MSGPEPAPADHAQQWLVTRQVSIRRQLSRVHEQIEALSTAECLDYLRAGGIGRVAFMAQGLAIMLPVSYVVDGEDIVFLTNSGSKLRAVQQGATLTFEIDHLGPDGVGWSVLVAGPAWSSSSPARVERARALGAHPPTPEARAHAVGVHISAVTGRRFGLPGRPLRPGEP